jgi:hypothetical protein
MKKKAPNPQKVSPLVFEHLEIDKSLIVNWSDLSFENELNNLNKIANGIGKNEFRTSSDKSRKDLNYISSTTKNNQQYSSCLKCPQVGQKQLCTLKMRFSSQGR